MRLIAVGLFAVLGASCTFVSTGARSAIVVLVRSEVTTSGSAALPMPPREELKSLLSQHFLWLADDARAAQWIAYVDVKAPPTPLQPFSLTLREVKKNPDWRPLEVSTPLAQSSRNVDFSRVTEANEENERRNAGYGR